MRYDPTLRGHTPLKQCNPRLLPILTIVVALFLALPDPAVAADNIFGGQSPLQRFIVFITGIFAYMLVIVGLILTLGGLILGSDMSGFARRAPLVVVCGAVLILADIMVGALFGAQGGYELPAPLPDPLPEVTQRNPFGWTDGPLGSGFAVVTGPVAVLLIVVGVVGTLFVLRREAPSPRLVLRLPLLGLTGAVLLLAHLMVETLFGTVGDIRLTSQQIEALQPWSGATDSASDPAPQVLEYEQ